MSGRPISRRTSASELLNTVLEFQQRIVERLAGGYDVRQHYRPCQPQSLMKIHHVHNHLQPRELFDQLYRVMQKHETALFRNLTADERERVRTLLRAGAPPSPQP